mgnify:CR=1 FL=1
MHPELCLSLTDRRLFSGINIGLFAFSLLGLGLGLVKGRYCGVELYEVEVVVGVHGWGAVEGLFGMDEVPL